MTLRRRNPIPSNVREAAPSITACTHPAALNSMCVVCGAVVEIGGKNSSKDDKSGSSGTSLTMTGGKQLKFLSEQAVLDQQCEKAAGLHGVRKLALILDLDHTLIHTIAVDYAPSNIEALRADDIHHLCIDEKIEGVGSLTKHYIVKKRPHLDDFLRQAHEHFQMTIYTAGTRKYAAAVANMIDPTGKLFSGRIVSRSDVPRDERTAEAGSGLVKSLKRLFLGDASMAIIVDDREDVWRGEQSRQLYVVRPFVHFKGAHEVNNSAGTVASHDRVISMLHKDGSDAQSSDVDDQLLRCYEVAMEMHKEYYADYDAAMAENSEAGSMGLAVVLAPVSDRLVAKREKVLFGCVISFSGLIPINESNPAEKCQLWRLVLSLGGQVSAEVTARTTHLVTASAESKKVSECVKRGNVWILHPDWILYTHWAISKAPEATFMVAARAAGEALPSPELDPTPLPVEYTRPSIAAPRNVSTKADTLEAEAEGRGSKRSREEFILGGVEEEAEFHRSIGKMHKKHSQHAAEAAASAERNQHSSTEDAEGASEGSDDDAIYGGFEELLEE